MAYGLDLERLPEYRFSAFKKFEEGEKHVTRICQEDVLILMLAGTLYFQEDGRAVEVTEGQYYIQRHGLFQEGILPSSGAKYYYIHFCGVFCERGDGLPLSGSSHFTEGDEGFRRLEFFRNVSASKVEQNGEFYRILAQLKGSREMTVSRKCVLKVISLVTGEMERPYSLEQLASACGYSKNHLIHMFKEETGQTPFAYLTGLRINEARVLLANSDMAIGQISQKCGFGSYINFYKAFVKCCGLPPEEWRRQKRGY